MCNYRNSNKWLETWKNYKKNNKEKIAESNRKYYLKWKNKKKTIINKEKIVKKPIINIVNKPIILDFS